MKKVDLNSDLGEAFGAYALGMDQEVLSAVTSANIACGFHAGDPMVMDATVKCAMAAGVALGAHPGHRDLVGFGRRKLAVSPEEAKNDVLYQLGALYAFAKAHGGRLQHVKLHGALYNQAAADMKLARAICRGIASLDDRLIFLGLANSCHLDAAREIGLPCASEVFADRGYMSDGSLVPRTSPGAMITDEDEAVARVLQMIETGTVKAVDGSVIALQADSVCLHGDQPKAVVFARRIRRDLEEMGVAVLPLEQVL